MGSVELNLSAIRLGRFELADLGLVAIEHQPVEEGAVDGRNLLNSGQGAELGSDPSQSGQGFDHPPRR